MTNSQVKKAIDETISNEPMMNEAFVQKMLHDKKRLKKPIPFLQPTFVMLLMVVIGTLLYFTPHQKTQAVDIEASYLTTEHKQLIAEFYGAIKQRDKKALARYSAVDSEEALQRYAIFDFIKPVKVVKTIESEETIHLFVRLHASDIDFLDELVINKNTGNIELDSTRAMVFYNENAELPKEFLLEYRVAPNAPQILNLELNLSEAVVKKINGHTLYQIPTDEGTWRVFETPEGKRFDLNIASAGSTHVITGGSQEFYFIDSETIETTYIYRNDQGNYQIVTGQLEYPSVTTYATDFHEEPILILSGDEPKVITTQQGQLVYANVFEQVEFINSPAFYQAEAIGKHLLVKYSEDLKQMSSYYQFTAPDILMDDRKIGMLEAKPEHLQDMILQNRYNSQILYVFAFGTLHYSSDTRLYYEKPKSADEKPASGELIEAQYTNIQITTKDNQYFITGDDGFSWTLTRIAPRILKDEKGIEYTTYVAFEDIPEMSEVLIEDEIQSVRIYKNGGTGTNAYVREEDLDEIKKLFTQAAVNKELVTLEKSKFVIEMEYYNGKKVKFELWLKENQKSIVMNLNPLKDTYTIFTIPEALADYFRQLVEKIEGIDNSK